MRTIYAGTAKGLFVFRPDEHPEAEIFFPGLSVFAVGFANGKVWASPFSEWTGSSLYVSEDDGRSWAERDIELAFPESAETALKKIWQIKQGPGDKILFGVEPSALFSSDDDGSTWELCEGLWNHPHREHWGPGYGGQCLHTILPLDDDYWVVAMSTGGAYITEDAGESWRASNTNIKAPFLPDELPEFGQCVHKIAADPGNPNRLFLQHHWGVYRSDDRGNIWTNISEGKNLPTDFGFGIVSTSTGSASIIPIKADEFRVFPDGKCSVFQTTDSGETWKSVSSGLPETNAYDCVLRDSFSNAGEVMGFGTTGGSLFYSEDQGNSWETVSNHLPRITCVRIT